MSELKPCPFCGHSDTRFRGHYAGQITCTVCGAEGPESIKDAVRDKWNRRPLEEALEARVKELEAELEFSRLSMNGAISEAEKYIYDITDQQEYDPEQYGINLVQILAGYFEEIIAQAKAAAVQWVTYDEPHYSRPDAQHPERLVIINYKEGQFEICPASKLLDDVTKPWRGDRWAYLPTPEEVKK